MVHQKRLRLVLGAGLVLALTLSIADTGSTPPALAQRSQRAQPSTPGRGPAARPLPAGPAGYPLPPASYSSRDAEKAWRDIGKAQEEAASVAYLATLVDSAQGREIIPIAERLLNQARSRYEAGQYFQAREMAKAAKDTYEAIETLYEGELGYKLGRHGPEYPSRSYLEAPFRVGAELAQAEAEINYYGGSNSTAADLLRRAQALARPATTASAQPVAGQDFAYLAQNRAAIHLAKAATRVMRADRGF